MVLRCCTACSPYYCLLPVPGMLSLSRSPRAQQSLYISGPCGHGLWRVSTGTGYFMLMGTNNGLRFLSSRKSCTRYASKIHLLGETYGNFFPDIYNTWYSGKNSNTPGTVLRGTIVNRTKYCYEKKRNIKIFCV